MSAFRHRRLRWGVAALLLLTGLCAQMQSLFACELMEGAPTLVCCCDRLRRGPQYAQRDIQVTLAPSVSRRVLPSAARVR
ncbi:MAG: hypothetical protein L0Z53_21630, partial [Acidobacteriales bacterium]|nr:hypothetical protein [Terriglobales bacterium]